MTQPVHKGLPHGLLDRSAKRELAPEHKAMPTRIYDGAGQVRGDDRRLLCRPARADMPHHTQMG